MSHGIVHGKAPSRPFRGANIALFFRGQVLVYLRDNIPDLPFANMWDFPGGRRDGDETPVECVIRETFEEFSITLDPAAICYQCVWPSTQILAGEVYFLAAHLTEEQVQGIKLGDEGQCWDFIPISSVSGYPGFIPHLQTRFEACLRALSTERSVAAAFGLAMSDNEPVTEG